MSMQFVRSSSQYLEYAGAVAVAAPITMVAWARIRDIVNNHVLIGISSTFANGIANYDNFAVTASGASTGDPVRATCNAGTTNGSVGTTTSYPENDWFHAAAVFRANNDRSAYLNGGGRADSSVVANPTNLNRTGTRYAWANPAGYPDGLIQWPAIWKAALTDSEIMLLASGADPRTVRPDSLVAFWDFDEFTINPVSSPNRLYTLTNNNGATYNPEFPYAANRQKQRRYWQFLDVPFIPSGNRRRRIIIGEAHV